MQGPVQSPYILMLPNKQVFHSSRTASGDDMQGITLLLRIALYSCTIMYMVTKAISDYFNDKSLVCLWVQKLVDRTGAKRDHVLDKNKGLLDTSVHTCKTKDKI